jgi:DNA invertase Pin-like site-specific DNA recombinase
MSEKIKPEQLARKAVLYIRQSSTFQVTHNQESRRLQYAMTQRIRNLGWQEVSIIDEDLGRSASGEVERRGFQKMVAEVCLGRVGVVAAREVSRFARNSRDWQQLIEVCRMVDTLLMDQEVIYGPRNSNDRLLLGLKGSLNEYELDLLRQRSQEARRQKASPERAQRQYDLADPENRLVTGELERRWNITLDRVREMGNRLEEARSRRNQMATPCQELFRDLRVDLRTVWEDSNTDIRLKKRIVRALIEEVVADVDGSAGEVILIIHWKGDIHTEVRLPRRRRGQSSSDTPVETIQVVRLLALICDDQHIAGFLNRNGLRTGPRNRWTQGRVVSLRNYHGIPVYSEEKRKSEGWMNLGEASVYLKVASKTLRRAAERGDVPSRHPLGDGPWLFQRADLDLCTVQREVGTTQRHQTTPAGQGRNQLQLELSQT